MYDNNILALPSLNKKVMSHIWVEEKIFELVNFATDTLPKGNYENCRFINCNFSDVDLSETVFSECEFTGCNLSMAKLHQTALRDIKFNDCKLIGLHFKDCNELIVALCFNNCNLNLSTFYTLKLKKTIFNNSNLTEVDFTDCDLTGSVFTNCNLTGTVFENTILEKADLRTSYNYSINPELNRIKKAKFSVAGIAGLLNKYDIVID